MKRYTITQGAKTTAGGEVIHASSHGAINGVKIALENDPVFCKACGVVGRILCVGPRLSERWNGVQVALENDLCNCRCVPAPKLIPNQSLRAQIINDSAASPTSRADALFSSAQNVAGRERSTAQFDQHFYLTDERSGRPLVNWDYKLILADGSEVQGKTDQEGKTMRISSSQESEATLFVFEPTPASLNSDWDR